MHTHLFTKLGATTSLLAQPMRIVDLSFEVFSLVTSGVLAKSILQDISVKDELATNALSKITTL
jgi:hypothetical protein